MLGEVLDIIGRDPSVFKSNRCFTLRSFGFSFNVYEVYSINSSEILANFPKVSTSNKSYLKLHQFTHTHNVMFCLISVGSFVCLFE